MLVLLLERLTEVAVPFEITPVIRLPAVVPPRSNVCTGVLLNFVTSGNVRMTPVGLRVVVWVLPAPRPNWLNVIRPSPEVTVGPAEKLITPPPIPPPFCAGLGTVNGRPTIAPGVGRSEIRLSVLT